MTFVKRFKLFMLYYVFVIAGLTALVWFNVLAPQREMATSFIQPFLSFRMDQLDTLTREFQILFVIVSAILPAMIIVWFKNRNALAILFLTLIALGMGWYLTAAEYALLLPIVEGSVALVVGLLVGIFLKMIYSSAEKDFLRAAFTQFVSEDMLKELLKDPDKLRLTGKEHDVTVMFLDIRGFTAYSEKKTPAIVVARLNELLDLVTHVIIKHDGTVDKYIGDAVMAMWGAPAADKKQATKACLAALEIKKKIESETDFSVGIGINYGSAIVGNIGSSKRFDYTVIGDTVNTASRIEGLTKSLGQNIVISKSVKERVELEKGRIETQDLGQVLVKGKNQKLAVFGLLN